jgi:hypothetical protein
VSIELSCHTGLLLSVAMGKMSGWWGKSDPMYIDLLADATIASSDGWLEQSHEAHAASYFRELKVSSQNVAHFQISQRRRQLTETETFKVSSREPVYLDLFGV